MLQQLTGETIGELRAVSGMHQRKAEMARQADAFIALPGKFKPLPLFVVGSVFVSYTLVTSV